MGVNQKMIPPIKETLDLISKTDWKDYLESLKKNMNLDVVDCSWEMYYNPEYKDLLVQYEIKSTPPETYILQIWAINSEFRLGIPGAVPSVKGIVDFKLESKVTSCIGAVIDSKWNESDIGKEYGVSIFGWVQQKDTVIQFGPFDKQYTFPPQF